MLRDWRPSLALDVVKYCTLHRILIWRVASLNGVLNVGDEGELNFMCACPTIICLIYLSHPSPPLHFVHWQFALNETASEVILSIITCQTTSSDGAFWMIASFYSLSNVRCALNGAGHGWAVAWMNKMFKGRGGSVYVWVIDWGEQSGTEVWLN